MHYFTFLPTAGQTADHGMLLVGDGAHAGCAADCTDEWCDCVEDGNTVNTYLPDTISRLSARSSYIFCSERSREGGHPCGRRWATPGVGHVPGKGLSHLATSMVVTMGWAANPSRRPVTCKAAEQHRQDLAFEKMFQKVCAAVIRHMLGVLEAVHCGPVCGSVVLDLELFRPLRIFKSLLAAALHFPWTWKVLRPFFRPCDWPS